VTFSSGGVVLAGSLAVPGGGEAPAGVVMVGGSGPSDRNNDTYFPPIRQHLLDAGIAVLSYDKRGVGGSSGDWHDAAFDDLAGDAAAALDFLRAQPGVRAGAAGLFGHSEGGWVVLRAAARGDVPWVVTSGCPGMTPAAQERHSLATALRQAGVTARQDIEEALAVWDQVAEAGRRGAGFAEATRIIRSARRLPVLAEFWAEVDEPTWEFIRRTQDHDPVPDALRLHCPYLAVFGGADHLVAVADSARRFSDIACHPDRDPRATLTVQVYPGASHRVQASDGTLAPGYLATLTWWIKERGRVGPDA
jgi:alpha-beta hydrolase superfamily lysophospholipase